MPGAMEFRFSALLWLYPGDAGWHFITLPDEVADQIRERAGPSRRGFGSLRVAATIGEMTWNTSIFPDRKSGSFVLGIKKEVRTTQQVGDGDVVDVRLDVLNVT